jgi:hypothetical protein
MDKRNYIKRAKPNWDCWAVKWGEEGTKSLKTRIEIAIERNGVGLVFSYASSVDEFLESICSMMKETIEKL